MTKLLIIGRQTKDIMKESCERNWKVRKLQGIVKGSYIMKRAPLPPQELRVQPTSHSATGEQKSA